MNTNSIEFKVQENINWCARLSKMAKTHEDFVFVGQKLREVADFNAKNRDQMSEKVFSFFVQRIAKGFEVVQNKALEAL